MKEKRECKIIQDLLPNYIEKLTNEETNNYIEEHLKECDECKEMLKNMQKSLNINVSKRDNREVRYIKKYSEKLRISKLITIIILAISLLVMAYYYFYFRDSYIRLVNDLNIADEIYSDTFYATIEEIIDPEVEGLMDIKVKGLDINDINHRGEYYFSVILSNIGDNFKIKWNETDISFEQLKVGQTIAIQHNHLGNVVASNNNLNSVTSIVVLDEVI